MEILTYRHLSIIYTTPSHGSDYEYLFMSLFIVIILHKVSDNHNTRHIKIQIVNYSAPPRHQRQQLKSEEF